MGGLSTFVFSDLDSKKYRGKRFIFSTGRVLVFGSDGQVVTFEFTSCGFWKELTRERIGK